MATSIISQHTSDLIVSSLKDVLTSGQCYLTVGRHLVDGSDSTPATVQDSARELREIYSHAVASVQLTSSNIRKMLPRKTWISGQVVPCYDPAVPVACYTVVETGAIKRIYKCIDNNNQSVSTVEPTGTSLSIFQTADGYVWKYMFSISAEDFQAFATSTVVPLTADVSVQNAAVDGTVDVIRVNNSGAGYRNYLSGSFRTTDMTIGSSTNYKLSSSASSTNDWYNGCLIEIVTPSSPAYGQTREIVDYNGSTKIATLSAPFTILPQDQDQYEVSPKIQFTLEGYNLTAPLARAIINTSSNSVSSVKVLSAGANIRGASANVAADSSVGVATSALLTAVLSPIGGHGSSAENELQCTSMSLQANVNLATIGIPQNNEIRTAAVVYSPLINNVQLTLTSSNPNRFTAENVIIFDRRGSVGTVNCSGSTLTCNTSMIRVNDPLLVAGANGNVLVEVASITNSTSAQANTNTGTALSGTGYLVDLTGTGQARIANNYLTIDGCPSQVSTGKEIYGKTSRAIDSITSININGRSTTNSLVSAVRLTGSVSSGTFLADEIIQPSVPNGTIGYLHSVSANNDCLFLTNTNGTLSAGSYVGANSGAVFVATSVAASDIDPDSGKILYIKNVTPISIANNKQLSVKLTFDFN